MEATELPVITDTKLKRIAYLSSRDKDAAFDSLMHHFNKESLFLGVSYSWMERKR